MEDKLQLEKALESYDIPFTKRIIFKLKWARFIPICPKYKRDNLSSNVDDISVKDVELRTPSTRFWSHFLCYGVLLEPETARLLLLTASLQPNVIFITSFDYFINIIYLWYK